MKKEKQAKVEADLDFDHPDHNLAGEYTITETEIELEPRPYTKVACPEGSLSDQYIQLLDQVDAWALINEQLFFGYGEGAGVMGYENAGDPPVE